MKTTMLIYASFYDVFKHPKLIHTLSWFVQNFWTHQNINTKGLMHSICLVLNGISSPLTTWWFWSQGFRIVIRCISLGDSKPGHKMRCSHTSRVIPLKAHVTSWHGFSVRYCPHAHAFSIWHLFCSPLHCSPFGCLLDFALAQFSS